MIEKHRPSPTEEVKDAVVRDYLRGDKTIVIQMSYDISPGVMYRILKMRGLKLRTAPAVEEGKAQEPDLGAAPAEPEMAAPAPGPAEVKPRCRRCGREYDPGITKAGRRSRGEPFCWICSGWAQEFRGPREVYNEDGSKVTNRVGDPWNRHR